MAYLSAAAENQQTSSQGTKVHVGNETQTRSLLLSDRSKKQLILGFVWSNITQIMNHYILARLSAFRATKGVQKKLPNKGI